MDEIEQDQIAQALAGFPNEPRPELTDEEKDGIVDIAMHPSMFDAFVDWVRSNGHDVSGPVPTANGSVFRIVSILGPLNER